MCIHVIQYLLTYVCMVIYNFQKVQISYKYKINTNQQFYSTVGLRRKLVICWLLQREFGEHILMCVLKQICYRILNKLRSLKAINWNFYDYLFYMAEIVRISPEWNSSILLWTYTVHITLLLWTYTVYITVVLCKWIFKSQNYKIASK